MNIDDLTTSVEKLNKSTERVVNSQQIRTRLLVAVGVALIITFIAGFLVADSRIDANTRDIRVQLLADCQVAKDIGESEVTPTTGELGRSIVKGFRNSYNVKCVNAYGPLKAIDPDINTPIQTPAPR